MSKTSTSAEKIYLVHGKRTPFGKFGGSLKAVSPVDLAVTAGKAVLLETKLAPDKIGHVVLGNVAPSTTDAIYGGRHVALKLGMPQETPGYVVNRLCGSGIQAILDAVRMIKLGEHSAILAGGTENMSLMPHLVYGSRFGTKYGALETVDMLLDTLTDKYTGIPMGMTAEKLGAEYALTRADCDQFAYQSHMKAKKAYEANYLQKEIVPFELKKGTCEKDEHLREDASLEQMNSLRSVFQKDGLVTAASASGVVDGASMVLVASESFVQENHLNPIAEIVDGHVVGVDPTIMGVGPVPAINQILEKNKLTLEEIALIEINEAFAAQTLACQKALKIPDEKLNIWGGAVSLGHPLAASGTRITYTLCRQLQETNSKFGIASACIGGGQGIAILMKKV
jgi:acetyl-CoA acyltransferase 2